MRLKTKFILLLLGFAMAFMGYVHLWWLPQLKSEIVDLTRREYQSHLSSVAEGLVPLLLENQLANVYETLDALAEDNTEWLQITLYSLNGQQLYPLDAQVKPDVPDSIVLEERVGFIDPPLGKLSVVADLAPGIQVANRLEHNLGVALSLLMTLFLAGVLLILELLVRKPLTQLVGASTRLAQGDYDAQLPAQKGDEIGLLTHSFAEMREALEQYHQELSGEIDEHRRTADALKDAKLKADYDATHDSLTGLINRREFERLLREALEEVDAFGAVHTLLYIDLDQFKVVNDTCGHIAGDELLRQISELLNATVREQDVLARLGGDEFGLLLNCCTQQDALGVGNKICAAVSEYRFSWEGKAFTIGASIGAVQLDSYARSLEALLSQADSACYMAKEHGRNRVHLYTPTDASLAARQAEMQWTTRLTKALQDDRFLLYVQPILPLQECSGLAPRYEVLLRLHDEEGGVVLPGAFIPAAERYGLIASIDHWVFDALVAFMHRRREWVGRVQFNINISGVSICDLELLRHIVAVLSIKPYLAPMFCFEITESEAVRNMRQAHHFIHRLKHLGCRFALDDFGSGMSSFTYLKNLPVDYLKIDGSFVLGVDQDDIDRVTVRSIKEIAQAMGMQTVAEYVENAAVRDVLVELGVDYGQGYFLGRPQPLTELSLPAGAAAEQYL